MITVIAGTTRPDSRTLQLATQYFRMMQQAGADVHLISLFGYAVWERGESMLQLEEQYLIPSGKFFFIMPEYNGSFPGALKMMMDHSDIKKCWWGKKAGLTGLADGRAGNLRGLDHMTNILNYLKVEVHWNKVPLSKISEELDEEGGFRNPATEEVIAGQIESFLRF